MDFLRREIRRRRRLEAVGVILRTLRQAPHAGVMHRLGAHVLDERDLAVERRIDFFRHDLGGARFPVARNVLGLRLARNGVHHHGLAGFDIAQAGQLRQRFVEHKVRRYHAKADIVAHNVAVVVEQHRDLVEA